MKSYIALTVAGILCASTAFANQSAVTVVGFDKIQGTTATDCTFVSQSLNGDGTVAVGINSDSAEYLNTLVRIPKSALPLSEGYSYTDSRGMVAEYNDGKLTISRSRGGLGDTEFTSAEIIVDAALSRATEASVVKKDGLLGLRTEASIQCQF